MNMSMSHVKLKATLHYTTLHSYSYQQISNNNENMNLNQLI